ncbi:MAG: PqiC family protein [Pseudomonadota bacterium]|nr:PqiC family protein [Pseudomonadota bacterium]
MKRIALMLSASLALVACGSSPEPHYFALASTTGPVLDDVRAVVRIQRPFLAGYLDRPDLVRQDRDFQVEMDSADRWAEPLDTMFERILMQDLQQRLPAAAIVAEDSGMPAAARFTLTIAIQQFNAIAQDQTALQAQLTIRDKGAHEQPLPEQIHLTADSGTSPTDDAQHLSALVGQLADRIAVSLHNQMLKPEKAPTSPAVLRLED